MNVQNAYILAFTAHKLTNPGPGYLFSRINSILCLPISAKDLKALQMFFLSGILKPSYICDIEVFR